MASAPPPADQGLWRLCLIVPLVLAGAMAVHGRVAAPMMVVAAVTLPLLYLPKQQRLRVVGMEGGDGDQAALSPIVVVAAVVLTVVGTVGGYASAAVVTSFSSQPHHLFMAYVALATAVLGPMALIVSIWRRARWWMAAYCFLVLGQLAVGYVAVYLNDVFGPFGS